MKYLSVIASIIACAATAHSAALAQGGPIEPCTYTTTSCLTIGNDIATITAYEVPFVATATQSFDCQGCGVVTVESKNCFGVGPVKISTTIIVEPESTTTVDVCSPTPTA